ncbi:MAG: GIY-YIG nuclease family protein, partial [bacterium]
MASCILQYPLGTAQLPLAGVYLFTEGQRHLYVGRANNLRTRLNQHQRESSHANTAAFAALLAKEKCKIKREYGPKHARQIPENWHTEFSQAKARIR